MDKDGTCWDVIEVARAGTQVHRVHEDAGRQLAGWGRARLADTRQRRQRQREALSPSLLHTLYLTFNRKDTEHTETTSGHLGHPKGFRTNRFFVVKYRFETIPS